MVNTSATKYNVTSVDSYSGLIQDVNIFVGGTVGIGLVLVIWLITFFSLQSYPNMDALKASTWVAWLTSLFMTLVGVVEPSFSILLFIMLLAITGYSSRPRR